MEPQPDYAATPANSKKYSKHSRKSSEIVNAESSENEASNDEKLPTRRKLEY